MRPPIICIEELKMKEPKCKIVTLTLTEACNLHCTYCYEHHSSNRIMNISTAKTIIDREFNDLVGYDSIEFDLFGGEPFLEFDLMRNITEYVCQKRSKIPCMISRSKGQQIVER